MKNMRNEMNAEVLEKVNGGIIYIQKGDSYQEYLKRKQKKNENPYGGAEGEF